MKRSIILLLVLAVLLVGCTPVYHGKVVAKTFDPAHNENYTTYMQVGDISTPILNVRRYPNRWYVTIEGFPAGQDEKAQYEWQITKEEYDSLEVGDTYDHKED